MSSIFFKGMHMVTQRFRFRAQASLELPCLLSAGMIEVYDDRAQLSPLLPFCMPQLLSTLHSMCLLIRMLMILKFKLLSHYWTLTLEFLAV